LTLISTGQAALALGLSPQTVRKWVAAGRLPASRRGSRIMIPVEAVQAEIERSQAPPAMPPTPDEQASQVAWRRQLLAALPADVSARLTELHDTLEDGEQLTADEQAELVRLEREMADAAARTLANAIRRGPAAAV
jgi:excisionase family DNA binding protein